jgi:hypothetical protein
MLVLVYLWLLPAEAAASCAFNFGIVPAFITNATSTDGLNYSCPAVDAQHLLVLARQLAPSRQ